MRVVTRDWRLWGGFEFPLTKTFETLALALFDCFLAAEIPYEITHKSQRKTRQAEESGRKVSGDWSRAVRTGPRQVHVRQQWTADDSPRVEK